MRLVFTPNGWADYSSWLKTDRRMLPRINRLIEDAMRHPFEGMGKPEPLRHALSGAWSRRITGEHRLVYLVDGDDLVILQAQYHLQVRDRRVPPGRAPLKAPPRGRASRPRRRGALSGSGVRYRAGRMCGIGTGPGGAAHSIGTGHRGIGGIMRKRSDAQRR